MDNFVAATGKGGDQGAVADEVDKTGNATAQAVEGLDCPGGKNGLHAAGDLQPEANIGIDIAGTQGQQVVASGNALSQLAQQGLAQHLLQLWLTDQHHLQQLFLVGFEVGQQAQLLQHLWQQMLGLIHQHHAALACRQIGQQVVANKVEQQLDPRFGGVGKLKLVTDGRQQIPLGQRRIQDIGDLGLGGQLLQQAAGDGGLAGAYFTGQ